MMTDTLNKLADMNTYSEGDYIGKDGLLYCGKCHTPKQTKLKWFDGKDKIVNCVCKCEAERKKKEEEDRKKQERQWRIQSNRQIGFVDKDMARCTFANDDHANEKVSKIAKNYVEHFQEFSKKGKGLVLCGGVGTGKTFIASCIANALIDEGYTCLVTNFSRIVNTLSGMFEGKQNYIDNLNDFDLLVIDDLATERNTEYMNEIVYTIIDSRYRSGKPLIVTTNLSFQALRSPESIDRQRVYSRILEMCFPVLVDGKDRRAGNIDAGLFNLLNG